jgi:hypothetical protein
VLPRRRDDAAPAGPLLLLAAGWNVDEARRWDCAARAPAVGELGRRAAWALGEADMD